MYYFIRRNLHKVTVKYIITKKFHFGHFSRGLIPVCITLLAISFGLSIASCNDSAIPEVEFPVPDEEQTELIPPSANPEPPELVQEYEDLWMQIESKHGKTGVTDTNAVLQANQIAIELAQYNGPMAQALEHMQAGYDAVISADSTDTIEDVLDKLREGYGGVSGKTQANCEQTSKSRKDCFACCAAQRDDDDWDTGVEIAVNSAVVIGFGIAGQVTSVVTGFIPGFFLATGGMYVGLGQTLWSGYKETKANATAEELCQHKCDDRFPTKDG